jgi:spermidine/putrescine ABC transporter ATP-binding subunit
MDDEPSGADSALSLQGVTLSFGGAQAVDDLTLAVAEGEFLTLLGPSGCGKSTTLRIIAGYAVPDSGDVFVRGKRITHLSPQRRNIGMVFQNYALFPHLTVARNIGFALSVRRETARAVERRVKEMLRLVRLEGFDDRLPSQLSGGQQQRVALARVLAFSPSLLLLDEPLSALDLRLREEMQGEIKRIQRELGITTIYVTHDQGEALNLSDRIAVMRNGRIEQIAAPNEIYRRPQTRFVASFVGKMQFLAARVQGFADNRQIVQLSGDDARLACICAHPLPPGQRCVVGIRPEKLQLIDPEKASARQWTLSGCVEERQYLGTHALVTIRTALEQPLVAVDQSDRYFPGKSVAVSWDETDMVVFAGDATDESLAMPTTNEVPRDVKDLRQVNSK